MKFGKEGFNRMVEEEFFKGGISQILLIVCQAIVLLNILSFPMFYTSLPVYLAIGISREFIFLAFAILLLLTTSKTARRFGGSKVGTVSAVFAIVTGIIGLILYVIFYMMMSGEMLVLVQGYDALVFINGIFFGVMLLALGLFFILYQKYVLNGRLWVVAGAAYMILGAIQLAIMRLEFPMIMGMVAISVSTLNLLDSVAITVNALTIIAPITGAVCFFTGEARQKE